jgi:hypothetical protein
MEVPVPSLDLLHTPVDLCHVTHGTLHYDLHNREKNLTFAKIQGRNYHKRLSTALGEQGRSV